MVLSIYKEELDREEDLHLPRHLCTSLSVNVCLYCLVLDEYFTSCNYLVVYD